MTDEQILFSAFLMFENVKIEEGAVVFEKDGMRCVYSRKHFIEKYLKD